MLYPSPLTSTESQFLYFQFIRQFHHSHSLQIVSNTVTFPDSFINLMMDNSMWVMLFFFAVFSWKSDLIYICDSIINRMWVLLHCFPAKWSHHFSCATGCKWHCISSFSYSHITLYSTITDRLWGVHYIFPLSGSPIHYILWPTVCEWGFILFYARQLHHTSYDQQGVSSSAFFQAFDDPFHHQQCVSGTALFIFASWFHNILSHYQQGVSNTVFFYKQSYWLANSLWVHYIFGFSGNLTSTYAYHPKFVRDTVFYLPGSHIISHNSQSVSETTCLFS